MSGHFSDAARICWMPDGARLSMRHGPIDLIVHAEGTPTNARNAYEQAAAMFPEILPDLCGELENLRKPVSQKNCFLNGTVANRMKDATQAVAQGRFITPMAAVAGAVADSVLQAMVKTSDLRRASVNNGGDIALHLAGDQSIRIGICTDTTSAKTNNRVEITGGDGVGGVATSGWQGRSHSLGIADSVTVLAINAALADAAATLIANAIDCPGNPAVDRVPACELSPDSDLGLRPVTVSVGEISDQDVKTALRRGADLASQLMNAKQIVACYGHLKSQSFALQPTSVRQFAFDAGEQVQRETIRSLYA